MMTFVDNHDTGASPWASANGWGQRHWPCPDDLKHRGYAYVLSMPGTPGRYWPDVFDWGFEDDLNALCQARRRAGVWAGSEWIALTDRHSGFAAIVKDEAGREALVVSVSSDWTGPGAGWEVAHSRPGEYAVWLRR